MKRPSLRLSGMFHPRRALGIDVGNANIKIVEVSGGKTPMLHRFAIYPTPRGSIENGIVIRPADIADAIRKAHIMGGFKSKKIATAITGQTLMLRHLTLPAMPKSDLKQVIGWQMESFIQMSKETTLADFILHSEDEAKGIEVTLIAMPGEPVRNFIAFLEECDFLVSRFEIEPLAVLRVVKLCYGEVIDKGNHVTVDYGSRNAIVNIFRNSLLMVSRVLPIGGFDFSRAVMVGENIDFQSAEELKILHGFGEDTPISRHIQLVALQLAESIATTLESFLSEWPNEQIDAVYLFGGNGLLPGVTKHLEKYFRITIKKYAIDFHEVCSDMRD
ncbi:MAG: pilus assembly protein PilM, partial [bacterium]|nr:pilus assembly protein PilM [bacterium]